GRRGRGGFRTHSSFDPSSRPGTDRPTQACCAGAYTWGTRIGDQEVPVPGSVTGRGRRRLRLFVALQIALLVASLFAPITSAAAATLRDQAGVVRVDLDRTREAEATPDDPGYTDQWSLARIGWDQVFGVVHPSSQSVVAVLDTGVDGSHADLAGRLVPGVSIL